jgi:predicted transcriptional regulator
MFNPLGRPMNSAPRIAMLIWVRRYLSTDERKMETEQILQSYFMERPLAMSVIHLLSENKQGLTATRLAEILHLSVPTLYRLTLEMHQRRLIVNEKKGRRNVFRISPTIEHDISHVYDNVKKSLDSISAARTDSLVMTNSILKDYNLSLSPRVAESMIFSAIKQKIFLKMPEGIRSRITTPVRTVLDESVRFDLCLGNEKKFVAIELKIIETQRGLRERIGTLVTLNLKQHINLAGIILAFIVSPIAGRWLIDDNAVIGAIESLNDGRKIKLFPVVSKAERHQVIDPNFLDQFSTRILEKVEKVLADE